MHKIYNDSWEQNNNNSSLVTNKQKKVKQRKTELRALSLSV